MVRTVGRFSLQKRRLKERYIVISIYKHLKTDTVPAKKEVDFF